jgi:hypothetical protein
MQLWFYFSMFLSFWCRKRDKIKILYKYNVKKSEMGLSAPCIALIAPDATQRIPFVRGLQRRAPTQWAGMRFKPESPDSIPQVHHML